jgi:hypothetical protein
MSTESRGPSNDLPDDSANATQASLRAGSLTGRRWCQWVGMRRPPQVPEGGIPPGSSVDAVARSGSA